MRKFFLFAIPIIAVIYWIAPDVLTGLPFDDILVVLLGAVAEVIVYNAPAIFQKVKAETAGFREVPIDDEP